MSEVVRFNSTDQTQSKTATRKEIRVAVFICYVLQCGTCTECSYSITNEACDTSGTGGACSKCDKKDESISTVVLTINYIVDNAAPTATLPTGITLTWFEGENQTTVGDTLKHNTDYAFTYSSEDYKVDEVKINDEIKSATDGKYAVKVQTVAISIVIKVSTIHKEAVLQTLSFAGGFETSDPNLSAYNKTAEYVRDNFTWTTDAFNNNNKGWKCIKCGWKTAATQPYIATQQVSQTVTKIDVKYLDIKAGSKINSIKLLVASNADFTDIKETVECTDFSTLANSTYTFKITTPSAGMYYKIVWDLQQMTSTQGNGSIAVEAVSIYGY